MLSNGRVPPCYTKGLQYFDQGTESSMQQNIDKEIARNYDKEIARKSTRPHSIAIKNLQERKTAALFRNEDTKRQDTAVSYYRISKMHPPSKSGIKASDPRTTHLTGLRDHHFKFLCVLLRRTGG